MVLFLGDIHGNFEYLKHLIISRKISDCFIIQVGDFGIGFTNPINDKFVLSSLNDFMSDKNIILIAIRGNHDDPDYFKGNHIYSNLRLVEDYTVMTIEDKKYLFIGGAISVDRIPRIANNMAYARYGNDKKGFWYGEKVVFDEDKLLACENIDIIVTHTAPEWCVPDNRLGFGSLVENFASDDSNLKTELAEERKVMSDIFNTLKEKNNIKKAYYGHFHKSEVTIFNNIEHHLLNINEIKELR